MRGKTKKKRERIVQTFIVIIVFDGNLLLPRKHVHADSLAQKPDYVRSLALKNLLLPFCTDESNRIEQSIEEGIFSYPYPCFKLANMREISLSLNLILLSCFQKKKRKLYNLSKIFSFEDKNFVFQIFRSVSKLFFVRVYFDLQGSPILNFLRLEIYIFTRKVRFLSQFMRFNLFSVFFFFLSKEQQKVF